MFLDSGGIIVAVEVVGTVVAESAVCDSARDSFFRGRAGMDGIPSVMSMGICGS